MAKVSELEGAELDYWVARVEATVGQRVHIMGGSCYIDPGPGLRLFAPSTNWAQGGPLIEKYTLALFQETVFQKGSTWNAGMEIYCGDGNCIYMENWSIGDTPLQAICRAVVRSVFGDEVEDV